MIIKTTDILTLASGHAGNEGAISKHGNTTYNERLMAKSLVEKVYSMLREKGYNKSYNVTPTGTYKDTSDQLKAEVTNANKYKAKLHLCVHFNHIDDSKAYGLESLIQAKGGNAEKYAPIINKEVSSSIGLKDRGVRVAKSYLGYDLYICKNTNAPCVLVEICFLSNADDVKKYNEDKVAKALFKALTGKAYTPNAPKPPTTSGSTSKVKYYQVAVASYTNRSNADKALSEVKAKGFKDSFITVIEK